MKNPSDASPLDKLEHRLEKLESQRWEKWVQTAVIPLVLLGLGAWINSTIAKGNEALERQRVASQQIDVAQQMVGRMFEGNPTRDFATARLVHKLTEPEFARQLDSVMLAFYAQRVTAQVAAGRVDSAAIIVNAAKTVGGATPGEQLTRAVGSSNAAAIESYSRANTARSLENTGFEALARGDVKAAYAAVSEAERIYPGFRISYELQQELRPAVGDSTLKVAVMRSAVRRYGQHTRRTLADSILSRATEIERNTRP
jgi:hypothetical protein